MKDPAFRADAREARAEIDPLSAAAVGETVRRVHEISPDALERARPMFGVEK